MDSLDLLAEIQELQRSRSQSHSNRATQHRRGGVHTTQSPLMLPCTETQNAIESLIDICINPTLQTDRLLDDQISIPKDFYTFMSSLYEQKSTPNSTSNTVTTSSSTTKQTNRLQATCINDAESSAYEVLNSILTRGSKILYAKYLDSKIVNHTISQCLQMTEYINCQQDPSALSESQIQKNNNNNNYPSNPDLNPLLISEDKEPIAPQSEAWRSLTIQISEQQQAPHPVVEHFQETTQKQFYKNPENINSDPTKSSRRLSNQANISMFKKSTQLNNPPSQQSPTTSTSPSKNNPQQQQQSQYFLRTQLSLEQSDQQQQQQIQQSRKYFAPHKIQFIDLTTSNNDPQQQSQQQTTDRVEEQLRSLKQREALNREEKERIEKERQQEIADQQTRLRLINSTKNKDNTFAFDYNGKPMQMTQINHDRFPDPSNTLSHTITAATSISSQPLTQQPATSQSNSTKNIKPSKINQQNKPAESNPKPTIITIEKAIKTNKNFRSILNSSSNPEDSNTNAFQPTSTRAAQTDAFERLTLSKGVTFAHDKIIKQGGSFSTKPPNLDLRQLTEHKDLTLTKSEYFDLLPLPTPAALLSKKTSARGSPTTSNRTIIAEYLTSKTEPTQQRLLFNQSYEYTEDSIRTDDPKQTQPQQTIVQDFKKTSNSVKLFNHSTQNTSQLKNKNPTKTISQSLGNCILPDINSTPRNNHFNTVVQSSKTPLNSQKTGSVIVASQQLKQSLIQTNSIYDPLIPSHYKTLTSQSSNASSPMLSFSKTPTMESSSYNPRESQSKFVSPHDEYNATIVKCMTTNTWGAASNPMKTLFTEKSTSIMSSKGSSELVLPQTPRRSSDNTPNSTEFYKERYVFGAELGKFPRDRHMKKSLGNLSEMKSLGSPGIGHTMGHGFTQTCSAFNPQRIYSRLEQNMQQAKVRFKQKINESSLNDNDTVVEEEYAK